MSNHLEKIEAVYGKTKVKAITSLNVGSTLTIRQNVYVVTVEFMYGDADGKEIVELEFQPDHIQELIEFLNFCSRCAVQYPHGKGGYDSYTGVSGYFTWVADDVDPDDLDEFDDFVGLDPAEIAAELKVQEEHQSKGIPVLDYWPRQDGEYPASFKQAHVTFYDQLGHPKQVTMCIE